MKNKRFPLFLIIITFISFYNCSTKKEILPGSIDQLKLFNSYTGVKAKKVLDKLHFFDAADTTSNIGFYKNDRNSASLYTTEFADSKTAESHFENMKNKISEDNSIFNSGKMIEIHSVNIFRCSGIGQTHYTFAIKNTLFWISCDDEIAPQFLQDYLDNIL